MMKKKINKSSVKKCPYCKDYQNRPLAVDTVVIREGKILLIKRAVEPFKGYWGIPGGHINWNETLESCARRELKEETNLELLDLKLLGVVSDPDRSPFQTIAIVYLVKTRGIAKAGDDAKELKFFHLDRLPEKLAFDHRQILKKFLLRGRHQTN